MKLAHLRSFDTKLWDEIFGEFCIPQGPCSTELQSTEGQKIHSKPHRRAETPQSKKVSMVSARGPCSYSSLAEAMSVAQELHLGLVRSETETHRLQVELSHTQAHVDAQKKHLKLQEEKITPASCWPEHDKTCGKELSTKRSVFSTELARLKGERDALVTKADVLRELNVSDAFHDEFNTLLWSEECGPVSAGDSEQRSHPGVKTVAIVTKLLRAQLDERSEEATRLCSALADAEHAAVASSNLRQELQEERSALELECSELSAQLECAGGDCKDLMRQTELLRTDVSTHLRNAEQEVSWHKSELSQATSREKSAVEARVQAMTVAEESLAKLTKQQASKGKASLELKRAVRAAAAEFSRRLTIRVEED